MLHFYCTAISCLKTIIYAYKFPATLYSVYIEVGPEMIISDELNHGRVVGTVDRQRSLGNLKYEVHC